MGDSYLGSLVILRHIGTMLGYCILFQLCAQPIAVWLGVAYKWTVIGLRKEGGYNWDISSYNARWKLYTAVQFIDLGAIGGTIYIVWWYKLLGCTIGKNCCLWPAGSDLFVAAVGPAFRSAVWLLALFTATHAMDFEGKDMNAAKQDSYLGSMVILRHIGSMLGYCIL